MSEPTADTAAVTTTDTAATGDAGDASVAFPFDEIEPGTVRRVVVDGVPVAVVRIDDDVYAIGDTCSHQNVSLSEGEVWCDERELECPKHSSAFSLVTGEPTTLPATQPVPVYAAEVVDGQVVVRRQETSS